MATTISYTSSKNSSGYGSIYYEAGESVENYGLERSESASAINLKTGTSVFSLDFPNSNSKNTLKKQPVVPKITGNKKSKSLKKQAKEKKPKKLLPALVNSSSTSNLSALGACALPNELDNDFVHALCITPVPAINSRDPLDEIDRVMSSSSEDDDSELCVHDSIVFQDFANETKSVYTYEKVAYPDFVGGKAPPYMEHLYHRKFGVQRYFI